jgi:hypothetical protein
LFVSDKTIDIVSDTPVVDNWAQQGTTEVCADTPITMKKGASLNIVELYEQGGSGANNYLKWSSASMAEEIIPASALTSPSNATVPDTGRITGQVVDPSGAGVQGAGATITSADGKTSLTLITNANGVYTGLFAPGTYTVTGTGTQGIGSDTSYQALKTSPASASATVTKNQIATVGNMTFTKPALANPIASGTMSLLEADLEASNEGWDFLQMQPEDTAIMGPQGAPNADILKQFCDASLPTTGDSKIVSGRTWLDHWQYVPGDSGGAGRNGDPDGIPDNSWWADALHFKVSGDVAKGTQFLITGFNADDYFEQACLNGVRIGGNQDANWSATRTLYVPTGVLKTDGSDNLLAMVGYEGGGGAGFNNTTVFNLVAYGPDSNVPPPPSATLGDLNADGKISVADATLSLRIAVGLLTPTDAQKAADDVNKDGKWTVGDTTLILQVAVGVKSGF